MMMLHPEPIEELDIASMKENNQICKPIHQLGVM